jgi:hypothetical protein
MTSITTNSFSENAFRLLKKDLDSASTPYHLAYSRIDPLTEGEDIRSESFQEGLRHTMLAVKTVGGSSYVVPSNSWNSGSIYPSYDNDLDIGFYVVNSFNEVFVCVETGKISDGTQVPSIIEPTSTLAESFKVGVSQGKTFRTTDQYKWRYMYPLGNAAVAKFKTNDWLPVKTITDRSVFLPIPQESIQRNLQDSSVGGEIINIQIDSGGYGFSNTSNNIALAVEGNGSGASFTAEVDANKIVRIRVDSDAAGTFSHGSGYDYASITVTGGDGVGAVLRPVIAPYGGLNANPSRTLKTKHFMLQTDVAGDEFDTILAENDFNQVSIVKGFKTAADPTVDFTQNTANGAKYFSGISASGTFTEDAIITNSGETATGKVVFHDTVNNRLYYYQDTTTGFGEWTVDPTPANNSVVQSVPSPVTATYVAKVEPTFNPYTGEILYINNINALGPGTATEGITRADTQTEDIRIVIQLG